MVHKKYYFIKLSQKHKFKMTDEIMRSQYPSMLHIPHGLPNLNNTCFLNSSIQQLYRIPDVLHQLLNSTKSQKGLILSLKDLFKNMKQAERSDSIRKNFLKITEILEKQLFNYKLGDQSDSFEVFLHLLNAVFDENSYIQNKFAIQYQISCKCIKEPLRFKEITMESKQMVCQDCRQPIKTSFVNCPQYLIVKGGNVKHVISELKSNRFFYKVQSRNVYSGNGYNGHYVSLCRYGDNFYKFNDSSVSPSTKIQSEGEESEFAILQKCAETDMDNDELRPRGCSVKKIILLIVVVILLVIAGVLGWHFSTQSSVSTPIQPTSPNDSLKDNDTVNTNCRNQQTCNKFYNKAKKSNPQKAQTSLHNSQTNQQPRLRTNQQTNQIKPNDIKDNKSNQRKGKRKSLKSEQNEYNNGEKQKDLRRTQYLSKHSL